MASPLGPLTVDVLERMYDQVRFNLPRYDTAHIGPRAFHDLRKSEVMYDPSPVRSLFGMELRVSPMFPYRATCPICHGTGEGTKSTYCPVCKGAGAKMVDGMMTGKPGNIVLLTSPLPRKFAPSWPADFPVTPRRPR